MSRKLVPATAIATLMSTAAIADVPSVAVDIAPVHSLVARVMEGVGTPDLVIPAGASPHSYNLRPSEARALQDADVVFWLGHDMTPWLEDPIETLAESAAVTSLLEADGTILHDFREGALFEAHDHGHDEHDEHHEEHADHHDHDHDHHEEAKAGMKDDHDHEEHAHDHEEHDHAHEEEEHAEAEHDHDHDHEEHAHDHDEHGHDEEKHAEHDHDHDEEKHAHDEHDHDEHEEHAHEGHDHGEHDPHAWLSPENAANWLNVIAGQLSAADPENAGAYFANAAAGREELEALKAEIADTLAPVKGSSFISFHDAYQYFEVSFDFSAAGAISLGDASDPSPARIAEIQGRIQNEGIDCVLAEPQYNPGLIATVLEGTDASTGVIDPLGASLEPGPGLYPQLLRDMAATLSDCLK